MVYINENSEYIVIPRHTKGTEKRAMSVFVTSPLSNRTEIVDGCNNTSDSPFYWKFTIDQYPPFVGEYTYEILANSEVIERGLLTYGDYKGDEIKSINHSKDNIQLKKN